MLHCSLASYTQVSGLRGGSRFGLFTQGSPPVVLGAWTSGQWRSEIASQTGNRCTHIHTHTHAIYSSFSHQKNTPLDVLTIPIVPQLSTHRQPRLPTKSIVPQMVTEKKRERVHMCRSWWSVYACVGMQ